MKFICLHGAIGNSQNFKVQIDPIIKELESDGTASFFFVQGQIPVHPPHGFQEYFGPGPHWRFINDLGTAEKAMLERIRHFPDAATAEDTLRMLLPEGETREGTIPSVRPVLDYIYTEMEKEGDIDGVIGYSEGGMVAATMLVEQERLLLKTGQPRRLKVALFFSGWPAMDPDAHDVLLADETEEVIPVPSIHVIGSGDPYLQGSMGLYNLFDEDTATLFDHAKGHTIPRDARTLRELGNTVREAIKKSSEF
ncbi:MAG: hypothetical protein Q9162_002916 [Coniocarpon cinnabarinum]